MINGKTYYSHGLKDSRVFDANYSQTKNVFEAIPIKIWADVFIGINKLNLNFYEKAKEYSK